MQIFLHFRAKIHNFARKICIFHKKSVPLQRFFENQSLLYNFVQIHLLI